MNSVGVGRSAKANPAAVKSGCAACNAFAISDSKQRCNRRTLHFDHIPAETLFSFDQLPQLISCSADEYPRWFPC
jgi:hypothetical protein